METAHLPCPYPSCGSSDAFSFNSKGFGKCHACDRGYPSKEPMYDWAKEKYPVSEAEVIDYTPKRIESPRGGNFVEMRGINRATMEQYNVLTYEDRQEYVYPSGGIKVRRLEDKQFYTKDGFKGDELFGMNLFPAGCSKIVTVPDSKN